MAELVLGVGSSHSPMVSMTGEDWLVWGERDHEHPMLYRRDGRHVSYAEQLASVDLAMAEQATKARCIEGAVRVQAAVASLAATLEAARLDAVVIIGDDQDEHLLANNLPPFLIYWGDAIANGEVGDTDDLHPMVGRFLAGYREPDGTRDYEVESDLARHVIDAAFAHDFDVATSSELPDVEKGMGHAFGFAVRRLIPDGVPIVPIMVNTYNPPSQPRASRCVAFGGMIRAAIDSFPGGGRVGVVASGGLSHFLVLEDLDREVLDALGQGDLDRLCAIPEATYVAGTSEIKNWITAAAACHDLDFAVVDYVPGYRTPAGSGTGLGFAVWSC